MRQMKNKSILIEKYIKPSEAQFVNVFFVEMWLNEYGDRHSFMGQPAIVHYKDGQVSEQRWYKKDVCHRDKDVPAVIYYNYKEQTGAKRWYKNGIETKQQLIRK